MQRLQFLGCGVLALFSAACGEADSDVDEGALSPEVGEIAQGLSTWSVSFQQGKPVVLCGPSADACTTLSASYTGTEDMFLDFLGHTRVARDEARLEAWSYNAAQFGVVYVKWDISALRGRLPANTRLASARVAFRVDRSSANNFMIAPGSSAWSEKFGPTDHPITTVGEALGSLAPRWTGLPKNAPRAVTATASLSGFEPYFRKWLDKPEQNYGLWIGHPGGVASPASLHSSEAGTPPALLLTFTQ